MIDVGEMREWDWESSDVIPSLKTGVAHVWLVELSDGGLTREGCWDLLSARERKRSERYTHKEANAEYVVSRAMLRALLAGYVGADPLDLSFRTAPGGKPFLIEIEGKPTPRFNMTHSNGVGLYAFAIDQEVGVDVEKVDRKVDAKGVAKRFFRERESQRICSQAPGQLKEAFVRTWTCKEACLKWTGAGLKGGLKTHEIQFSESWTDPKASGEEAQPALQMLEPGEGFIGALATGRGAEVGRWVWRH